MSSTRTRPPPNLVKTLKDLEDLPGPSLGIVTNKVQVTDIWLLKVSDDFGSQAAISYPSGYCWVDLEELQEVLPDKWIEYDNWYFEEFNRHPLSELRTSEAPTSGSESDEPAADWRLPGSRSTLKTVRDIHRLMAMGSKDYKEPFNSAAASTRAAVGNFLYHRKALLKWRKIYLSQVELHPIQGMISHARDKQLAASLGAWRKSNADAFSKRTQYDQLSWFRLVSWFVCWRVQFRACRKARTARSVAMRSIIKHSLAHWYKLSTDSSIRFTKHAKIWQSLMIHQARIYLIAWRIMSRAFTSSVRRPLRNALKNWSLSYTLSAKLVLFTRWNLRDYFNRLYTKERFIVSHHFKQICFTTWKHVSNLYAIELVKTDVAFNHHHRSLLVQAWHLWSKTKLQDMSTKSNKSRAESHLVTLNFKRWKCNHSQRKATTEVDFIAEDHFRTSASQEALLSWLDVFDIKSEEANKSAAAAAHRSTTILRNSWNNWQLQFKLCLDFCNAASWFYTTSTNRAFKAWREQCKLRCMRLESFESHIKTSYPAVFEKLDESPSQELWPTSLIAKTYFYEKSLPMVISMWKLWRRFHRPVDLHYTRLTRNWPSNIMQWIDTRSTIRFIDQLKNRCKSLDCNIDTERRAKSKAIVNTLRSKKMALTMKACFSSLRPTKTPQSPRFANSSSSDTEDDWIPHNLTPDVTEAWKALRNITASTHSTELPAPHLAAPVCSWSTKLSSKVRIMKEFSKLKHASSILNPAILQKIPTIELEDSKMLLRPHRLWSTSLDQSEYDSADKSEIIASYTYSWCLPLWLDLRDGENTITFWDCCLNQYTNVAAEACLPDSESDSALADQFLTFHGMSFAEPRHELGVIENLCSPLTIQGLTAQEAVSVTHAASPLSAPRVVGLAKDEAATDEELLKLAQRDAAALHRSPFMKKDKNPDDLPTPVHVSTGSAAGSLNIGQVSVMQIVRNTKSNSVGTVHSIDRANNILVRWDGDSSLSGVDLGDLGLVGLPAAAAPASPANPASDNPAANNSSHQDLQQPDRCYNQACGKSYESNESKCSDCNFPRNKKSYFGSCGHLTDPAKKWCQHPDCASVNTHFLPIEQQAQLQVFSSAQNLEENGKSRLFKDRHPSLRTKLTFVDADRKVFLLLRAGQPESDLKYSRTMSAPDYLCTMIDTEVGTLQRKADNINKFQIVHTWKLYYNTCNFKSGGEKNYGLKALQFDRYVADETSSSQLMSFDFTGAVTLDHSSKETTKYRDIDHWFNCHMGKHDWLGYHLQRALETELQAAVSYIKKQYHDTFVENLDIDVNFCEEVINALEKDFGSELRLFVTDKDQHLVRYPDTIWMFEDHQFVRPKFWIVHNGVERTSFCNHFREMKDLRRSQKFNELAHELKQVKRSLASGGQPKKKNGGDTDANTWTGLTKPVKTGTLLSSTDYYDAAVMYKELCDTINNGQHKDADKICWRNSTRTGCNRASCKRSHAKQIPPAVAKEWTIGHLICAAYGGFKCMPVLHKPNDVTTVVTALKKKLALAASNSNNSANQAGASQEAAPAEDSEAAPADEVKKPGSYFQEEDTATDTPEATPDPHSPLPMGDITASLVLVRPTINATKWSDSNQVLDLEGDQIKIKCTRNWDVTFPGRLGSDQINFSAVEKDLGQNLKGESNRCMILAEGAATKRAPTKLLEGYRSDGRNLRDHLPDGTNSTIKLHLDLFQMNFDGPMPDNDEIVSDLLVRSQPMSYHYSQILEQDSESDKAKVMIDVSSSCESDKVERILVHFICLVGSKASPKSSVSFRKVEKNHATWLDRACYSIGNNEKHQFKDLADYIQFSKPVEPICRFSFKPCVPVEITLTDFEGLVWPDFLPHSQLGEPQQFDLDYSTVGSSMQPSDTPITNSLLTKFRHATDLRNPNRISMDEFGFYIEDEVVNLTSLANDLKWSQIDLLHFDWYCFPVDDTRRKIYAIWEFDAKELEANEAYMSNFTKASELVLQSWGFKADGSAYDAESKANDLCGRWNGNFMRLYKIARSAWLLNQNKVLLAAQAAAWLVSPSGTFKAQGFDLSHLWSFTVEEQALVDKFGGCPLTSLDQKLIHHAARYRQHLDLASQNVSLYAEDKEWFAEQGSITTDLVKAVDEKFDCDQLKMLTKYARLYTPDASGTAADANRIQRMLMDNPTVQLESVLGRRLMEAHRYGVSADMECTRQFRSSVENPAENLEFAEQICKASRKLIVKGMKFCFPEACIPIIEKWEGILLSPNLIVFTEKKPEGRICQAMSANMGDGPNNLMLDHNLIPCVYDHALEATRAIYDMKDELEAVCKMVPGWEQDQALMQMLFRALAYVDDFHIVVRDDGGGTDLKQAFNHTNLSEDAVGIIACRLEIPEEWVPYMSAFCIIVWLVLNFGWIHSPANHQPVPLAIRNAVNNTCASDIMKNLPGYKFKPGDLSHLAMDALFRYIRYTEGYNDTIDFDKTQDIEHKLHRLGCTMFLDTLEIAVKPNHLLRALTAIQQGDKFELEGLQGVPLGWLQETLGQFRFAAVMPKSWIMGFIVPLLRCLKGVRSDAAPTTLCFPTFPFQSDAVSLSNLHRCRRALVVILKLMVQNPQCARLPMYLLLPPSEVIQRAPTERILFCGHDACDNGLATLVWKPNADNVVEVLVLTFSAEIRRLLHNSRHRELRNHVLDFLCMGNLEHSCIITNMLQFDEMYFEMLALQISDNQPTVGVTNKNFGSNFVDQEMCRLASLMKVKQCFVQMAIWVQTWLNALLDALSRMYIDGVLQDDVMLTIAEITTKLGITLKFVEPNDNVKSFMVWLESDKREQMSLVDHMESRILTEKSDVGPNLRQLVANKMGANTTAPTHHDILPSLASSACALSVAEIAGRTSCLINAVGTANTNPLTAAHICCGFGGMTIGSVLAGFMPILNVENNPAAIAFHELLTAGLVCCGDLDNLNTNKLPRVHNLTVGWPCPPHTCLGRRKGWNDERCRVKAVIDLILATLPYTVFGECVPGLLTSMGGKVFKYIIDQLSPFYHIHYEVVKFAHFGHKSNRRRLLMAMLLKVVFPEPDFSSFPTGHIQSLAEAGPVSECLIATTDVPESNYVSNPCSPLPANDSDPAGRLVYTHNMDNIRGAGSPKCPPAVFNSKGLAPTGLATVFDNEEEFGVNTGLVFRTNADGSTAKLPSRLVVQEIVNVGNFPYDTVDTAKAIGLTENQVSSGVNNAVPPSVCYPVACWFKKQLDVALVSSCGVCRDMVQKNKNLQHCGVDKVQHWLSPRRSNTQKYGSGNGSTAEALHSCLAAASLLTSASQINMQHKLIQWKINWNFALLKNSLVELASENENLHWMENTSPEQRQATTNSPIKLSACTSNLREAALTAIEAKSLSPGKVAVLPMDLKVELAYEMSLISDAPLAARFSVEHWLNNPYEAEASGNDWTVGEDCDRLTTEVIDAWSNLPLNAVVIRCSMNDCINQRSSQRADHIKLQAEQAATDSNNQALQGLAACCNLPAATLTEELVSCEQRRAREFDSWSARLKWQHLMKTLPMSIYRWLDPAPAIPCLRVEKEAMMMLTAAAEKGIALLLEPLLSTDGSEVEHPTSPLNGQMLSYILGHEDLAPVLLNNLHDWPVVMSTRALKACNNLYEVCSDTALQHDNWMSDIRTGRLVVWLHSNPQSERQELIPLLIDDCRNSMISLTIKAARELASKYAAVCKLSAEAVEAFIEASSSRTRAITMCRACDKMPSGMLGRLLGIRAQALISIWTDQAAGFKAAGFSHSHQVLGCLTKIRARQALAVWAAKAAEHTVLNKQRAMAVMNAVQSGMRPLLAFWLQRAMNAPAELARQHKLHATVVADAVQTAIKPLLAIWFVNKMQHPKDASVDNVDNSAMSVDTDGATIDTDESDVESAQQKVDKNITSSNAAKPVVTYLAEEREVLRSVFKDRIGTSHIHLYLASTGVKNLPGGTFNPCEKKHRGEDFDLRVPIKRKVGQDVAIGQLSKLLPDRPELQHVHICTRSPIAAQLARKVLKSVTMRSPTAEKNGGWDNIPASSILFRPPHPSKGNKRVKLKGKPPAEELAAEKEFEEACMGASLGGDTEKKYKGWVQQFTEYRCRCQAELLLDTNASVDAGAALKDLRFWVRRFLLNEGGVRGLQWSSINCKAYAIRWHYLMAFGLDVLADWVEHKIFMRGLKRVRHSPQRKMPVSWALLMYIVRQLGDGSWRNLIIMVAILVGWWFLCRISEIIAFRVGNVNFYDASGDRLNVDKDDLSTAVEVDLMFAVTKNDVDGDGAIRTHGRVSSDLCVVAALVKMVTYRRDQAAKKSMNLDPMSPLFKFVDDSKDSGSEKQITRSTIVRVLKAAASAAGIPEAKISCHSLRSGGAVQMLSVSGSSYSDVRLFGRWRSDCARIYLRAVRGMMSEVSARMAANSTDCTVMLAGGSRVKRY